jgi:hypothetical protein
LATKLQKHLEALGEETSGGAHDAVTFSGKGLGFLRDLFKSDKRREEEDDDNDELDDELDDEEREEGDEERDDDEERDEKERPKRRTKKSKRSANKSHRDWEYDANGGDLEEIDDEDDEDPGQEGDEEIITNHGRRVNAKQAVKKNAISFDQRRFAKSMTQFEDEYSEVLDASDTIADLSKHVRFLAKSTASMGEDVQASIRSLAKGLEASLRGQAALAADIELIKKQPATSPATGFVVLNKSGTRQKSRRLSKSDIADVVNDAMQDGLIAPMMNAKLATLNSQAELTDFVNSLPADVQARL